MTRYFYRPQRSWGKVIFSQASVILLRGRGCACSGCLRREGGGCLLGRVSAPGGVCSGGGVSALGGRVSAPGRCLVLGGVWSWGSGLGGVCSPGGCLVPWGVWSQGGLLSRGVCSPEGVCLVETPPGRLLLRAVRILLECIPVTYCKHCTFRSVENYRGRYRCYKQYSCQCTVLFPGKVYLTFL